MTKRHILPTSLSAVLVLSLAAWSSPPPEEAQQPSRTRARTDEVRKLLGAAEGGLEGQTAIVDLKEGNPAAVIQAAERFALSENRLLKGEEAVKFVNDKLRERIALTGNVESALEQLPTEAIVVVNGQLRPALIVCDSVINEPVPTRWRDKLNLIQPRLARTLRSVGLISCSNIPGSGPIGTGFVVAPGIIMTNRHVAQAFTQDDGKFQTHPQNGQPARVTIDFANDFCGNVPRIFRVSEVLHIEPAPGPDVALLRFDGQGIAEPDVLTLRRQPITDALLGREVYVAGYPFEDSRNPVAAQREIFGTVFGVKRLAPGELMDGSGTAPTGQEAFLFHDSSTLGGNSGSPVMDLASGEVIGIHFAGEFERKNWAWPIWRVLQIPKVKQLLDGQAPPEAPAPPTGDAPAPPTGDAPAPPTEEVQKAARPADVPPPTGGRSGAAAEAHVVPKTAAGADSRRARGLSARISELNGLLGDASSAHSGNEGALELQAGVPLGLQRVAKELLLRSTGEDLGGEQAFEKLVKGDTKFLPSRSDLRRFPALTGQLGADSESVLAITENAGVAVDPLGGRPRLFIDPQWSGLGIGAPDAVDLDFDFSASQFGLDRDAHDAVERIRNSTDGACQVSGINRDTYIRFLEGLNLPASGGSGLFQDGLQLRGMKQELMNVSEPTRRQVTVTREDLREAMNRPALFVCLDLVDPAERVPSIWIDDLQTNLRRIQGTTRSTGLIVCDSKITGKKMGTGFVVAPGLLMTNAHIAESFAQPLANGTWGFKQDDQENPAQVFIDFSRYRCPTEQPRHQIKKVAFLRHDAECDVALLELDSLNPDEHPPLKLRREPLDEQQLSNRKVFVVGYPFDDLEVPENIVRAVFFEPLGVKRIQPGLLQTGSSDRILIHDCSTLQGNSGSSLTDLQTGEILGIHYFGDPSPPYFNRAVPAWKLWQIDELAQILQAAGVEAG